MVSQGQPDNLVIKVLLDQLGHKDQQDKLEALVRLVRLATQEAVDRWVKLVQQAK
jgi:hypothetical protein